MPKWVAPIEVMTHPNFLNPGRALTYKSLLDEKGNLKSKTQLKKQGMLHTRLPYLKLQATYTNDIKTRGFELEDLPLDKILLNKEPKQIHKIYTILPQEELCEETVKETMIRWARNLGHPIQLDEWQQLWSVNYKLTVATSYKENLLKMFHRWHIPPARLAKMSSNVLDRCWKCNNKEASFYHCWWTCREAKRFWIKIYNWLKQMLKQEIKFNPELCLLGMVPTTSKKEEKYLIIHIMTAARLAWAQMWKSDKAPADHMIIKKNLECAESDKLTHKLKEKEEGKFALIWNKFYTWLDETQTEVAECNKQN